MVVMGVWEDIVVVCVCKCFVYIRIELSSLLGNNVLRILLFVFGVFGLYLCASAYLYLCL